MSKIVFILLIPVFLLSTSGFVLFTEYCEMSQKSAYTFSGKQSCCCKKDIHDKCCKKGKIEIKQTKDAFNNSSAKPIFIDSITILPTIVEQIHPDINNWFYTAIYKIYTPPKAKNRFPILYCCILI